MERTKMPDDGMIWWRKTGGGSLRFNGKIIKPNEKFRARPDQIPKGFRDVIIPLEALDATTGTAPVIEAVKSEYEVRPRGKSKSLFDVVYPVGKDDEGETIWKAMNEKPLPRALADKLKSELEK